MNYCCTQYGRKLNKTARNNDGQKSYFSARRYRVNDARSYICKVLHCVNSLVKAAIFQYSDSTAGWRSGYPEIIILAEAQVLSSQGSQRRQGHSAFYTVGTPNSKLHKAVFFLRSEEVLSYSKNSLHFLELEGSLPHSQASAACPYPQPDKSSPCLLIPLLEG